ncbi:MAG: DUF5752 family protein [Candidatus Omnitrophota bacterium]
MKELVRAKEPFLFQTRLHLTELTGLHASTLRELLALIKKVPGSCIYHHTHRFLQQHQFLSPEPPNDFAYWVTEALGEDELGEKLASIDTIKFLTIHDLRAEIINVIEKHLENNRLAKLKFSRKGEEFHFVKSASFILSTNYLAYDLKEFSDILGRVTIDSIYFHIFEARLRLERQTNDFSNWIETSIGDKKLADSITCLDPYTRTLDDLRKTLITMIQKAIQK